MQSEIGRDEALPFWFWMLADVIVLGFLLLLYLAVRARSYPGFIARWIIVLSGASGVARYRLARALVPLAASGTVFAFLASTGPLLSASGESFRTSGWPFDPTGLSEGLRPVAPVLLGLLAVLVVATLVAGWTGRPSWLAIPPCRGLTAAEVEQWVSAEAGSPERRGRTRHRRR